MGCPRDWLPSQHEIACHPRWTQHDPRGQRPAAPPEEEVGPEDILRELAEGETADGSETAAGDASAREPGRGESKTESAAEESEDNEPRGKGSKAPPVPPDPASLTAGGGAAPKRKQAGDAGPTGPRLKASKGQSRGRGAASKGAAAAAKKAAAKASAKRAAGISKR